MLLQPQTSHLRSRQKWERWTEPPPEGICPQLSLARAVSVDTLGYKKGSGEDEELTFSFKVKMGKGGILWWDLDSASACHPPRSETSTKAHYEIDAEWEDHTVCICEPRNSLLGNSESVYGVYGRDGKYVGIERWHALGLNQGHQAEALDWGWTKVFGWSEHMHLLGAGKMQVLLQWSGEGGWRSWISTKHLADVASLWGAQVQEVLKLVCRVDSSGDIEKLVHIQIT